MVAMPKSLIGLPAAAALLYCVVHLPAQTAQNDNDARNRLYGYIDGILRAQIQKRQERLAQILTRDAAERRKKETREKILRLIGGLPEHSGSVAVREFGALSADGFRVEKIAYESLPGFWVTADLYRPASGDGPFPAIVLAPGHGAAGKTENWSWGGNFARNGIVALAYDPIGQGERLQYYDAARNTSFIGNPTGEHGEANVGPMLLGDQIARYMVNDAMRGVDYLSVRKEVDPSRIGAFGCSGGGTMTAYFAALDDRVKAAAVACYFTSFTELLASPQGAQDAEQSIPHFIEEGMDFPDWAEAFAPKPYAVVSTENDMFPFAGARTTVDEARRFYGLYGAADKLEWITGPGGHGNLGPISPAILAFFTKNLKGSAPDVQFTPLRSANPPDMIVTPTGQVSTSIGGETVYSLNRKRAEMLIRQTRSVSSRSAVEQLRSRLQKDIRQLTGAVLEPGSHSSTESLTTKSSEQRSGYRLETVSLKSDGDTTVNGILAVPDRAGAKRPVLLLSPQPPPLDEIEELIRANRLVLALQPRPWPSGTESIKSPYLGVFNLLSLRAFLAGKTILGLRIDDAIRAVNVLSSRKDAGNTGITAYGSGPMGLVLLHAAVLDARISRLILDGTLTSYRMIVDQPVHRTVSEVVVPGVLQRYDTGDLLQAVFPRPITLVSPRDAMGEPVAESEYHEAMAPVFQSDEKLGIQRRIRFESDARKAIAAVR
jgi:cephalosporin-C deacetylase-like acetyl esterase